MKPKPTKMIVFNRLKGQWKEYDIKNCNPMRLTCSYSIAWRLAFGLGWTRPKEYAMPSDVVLGTVVAYGFLTVWFGPLAISICFNK